MKRILSLLFAFCVMVAAVGCSSGKENVQTQPNENNAKQPENLQSDDTDTAAKEAGKTLVVYYSATGSTEAVAKTIADTLDADVFEIVPANQYTSEDLDWTEDSSRVNAEHDDVSLRDIELVSDTVENWDSYDTVFIGYPIWWGIAAWPTDSFVKANNFEGKTVIPFCTSASSGLGESGELLAEVAEGGTWLEGERFRSSASEEDIIEWVNNLNLNAVYSDKSYEN